MILLPSTQHRLVRHTRNLLNLLDRILEARVRLVPIDQRGQLGELGRINLRSSGDQWIAHQDIRSGQLLARQPLATVW